MTSINTGRVILGGLVAGLVIDVIEFILNGIILAQDWTEWAKAANRPEMGAHEIVGFNIWGFMIGISAVWLYAAIRPRFGAGPGTAVKAALAVWFIGYLLGSAGVLLLGILPMRLMTIGICVGLVEVVLATLAGARIYQEPATSSATS